MIELNREQALRIELLFRDTNETLILSYLQGHHGRAWADRAENPRCAQVVVAGFCYFAGDAGAPGARELVANREIDWPIGVPLGAGWAECIRTVYRDHCRSTARYQFKKNGDVFDRGHLRRMAARLPEGYRIVPIDAGLYERLLELDLAKEYVANFVSCEDYLARGIGVCALWGDEIAGGASSYTVYDGGIEVEISTMPAHRRRGIAAACAASLVLRCLERGLYPSWDAANLSSKALAEKLGYHFDYEYDVYLIEGEPYDNE